MGEAASEIQFPASFLGSPQLEVSIQGDLALYPGCSLIIIKNIKKTFLYERPGYKAREMRRRRLNQVFCNIPDPTILM